jgi:protein-S-isoprenylcysteine O-methyltransferase Ste14
MKIPLLVEEKALIQMFGDEYIRFRTSRPIGIPLMEWAVESRLKKSGVIR